MVREKVVVLEMESGCNIGSDNVSNEPMLF